MNFEDLEVRIDKPYPELKDCNEDQATVGILKNLVNAKFGELPAVLNYVYQSVVADKTMEDIARILEEIGIVEMTHQDMLMHAITCFGGIPRYEDSQGNQFTTFNLNYKIKLKDMLEQDISAETMAIENYQQSIKRVKNQSLIKLFERIIEDEKRHIEIFNKIKDNVTFLSI